MDRLVSGEGSPSRRLDNAEKRSLFKTSQDRPCMQAVYYECERLVLVNGFCFRFLDPKLLALTPEGGAAHSGELGGPVYVTAALLQGESDPLSLLFSA